MSQAPTPAEPTGPGNLTFEKKSRKKRGPLYAVIAIVAVLAVVGGALLWNQLSSEQAAPPSDTVDVDGTLRVGLVLGPTNLDIQKTSGAALDQALIGNVYQGLIALTPESEIVPALASKYSVSDDGLTYTFEVRDDVVFHSGAHMTIDDVVGSLTTTRDDVSFKGSAALAGVTAITASDDNTVVLTLDESNSMLLWSLTGRAGLIYEQAATINYRDSTNGTGPFTLGTWRQGDSLSLTRFDDYYGKSAGVKTVDFLYITDPNAAINAALSGDIDVQTAVPGTLKGRYENGPEFTLHTGDSSDVFTLAYNNAKAPFTDERVRTAISQAIDQEAIIEALDGTGRALGGPIPPTDPGYRDLTKINAYDPENARKLLQETGQQNITLTLTLSNTYELTVPNLLVSQLADVGITLQLRQVEFATWLQDVYTNHDFDLSYVNHVEERDLVNYTNPDYYFGYSNPEVTSLYNQALRATDERQVDDLLASAAQIVAEDAPAKWVYNLTPITAVNERVKNFPVQGTNARLNVAGVTVMK
ncbi:ABC transporter substrate-binding protein [Lysinibacter sp. HNR]|uniref:ABC transporter substrate-binding protein n=1 Tax=Lysinibacter sp. HNR TaxID=3031408 RepID=UPI002434A722|nr:ABC transporter substrate-binding protein [Lysinibacter sp. HNR]WGD36906.1 ABC transporter substrate-binding protein [Lysinibacter sp. HNR]